jgi:predicted dehydrogenase
VIDNNQGGVSRRDVLKATGGLAAASVLAGVTMPYVHAAENNTIQVALIGCGGRGTSAAINALSVTNGPIKLVAMADVFQTKLDACYKALEKSKVAKQVEVPESRRFANFDGYQKAMDCLKPGDVAIFATPPVFRWLHFDYAIKKNLNVFMEKPVSVDGPTSRKMLKLGEDSVKGNLKVGVGLMCRHCEMRKELYQRIKDGAIGDIMLLRAYRMKGPEATCFSLPRPYAVPELHYQIQRFHSFLWLSGGCYSDFLIHNIDECCWMKDAWPVQASGVGGRHYRGLNIDQNFDHYSVEYTFKDGAKLLLEGRTMAGCNQEFASYAHGSKAAATISSNSHTPAQCRIFKGQSINQDEVAWKCSKPPKEEPNPYQLEWDHLIEAIRTDKPYNEVERGTKASLITSMGRMACHTGQLITYDQMLNCDHEFAPDLAKLTLDAPSPLRADEDGKYPVPQPGRIKNREYV